MNKIYGTWIFFLEDNVKLGIKEIRCEVDQHKVGNKLWYISVVRLSVSITRHLVSLRDIFIWLLQFTKKYCTVFFETSIFFLCEIVFPSLYIFAISLVFLLPFSMQVAIINQ